MHIIAFLLAILAIGGDAHAGVAEGDVVPPSALTKANPDMTDVVHGRTVLVNFWATWCGPCMRELPLLDALDARLPHDRARVVAVNIDRSSRRAQAVSEHLKLDLPVIYDPNAVIAERFEPPSLPASYVLSANGTVLSTHIGELDDAALRAIEAKITRPAPAKQDDTNGKI